MIQAVSHGRKRIVVPHCYLLCVNTCSRVAWFRVATSSPARRRIFAYLAFARARAAGSTSSGGSTTQVRTYCNRELVRANCACARVKSDCTCFPVFARVAAIRASSRRARYSAMRSSCFPALCCVLHRGRRLFARSRKTTAPSYRRPHNTQLHSSARWNHRAGDGGRFKFPEVGRSWTRTREGKPVYSIAWRA